MIDNVALSVFVLIIWIETPNHGKTASLVEQNSEFGLGYEAARCGVDGAKRMIGAAG